MKRWIAGRRLCLVPLLLLAFAAAPEAAAQTLSIDSPSVTEGDSGFPNLTFTVTLSPTSTQQVTVQYSTRASRSTATPSTDYGTTSGTLTFAAGTTSQTFDVWVRGDTTDETNETVVAEIGNASGATISTNTGTGTIIDDDGPTVSINSPSVSEGDSGSTNLTFTATLSATSVQQVTVDYADATTGTATSGTDYTAITGSTLTFAVGATSQTFNVSVTGDTTDEVDETVVVTLSSPTNATVSSTAGTGTGTITDDDGPTVSINSPSVTEGDSGSTNLTFTVTLSAASAQQVTVAYADAGTGTATSGTDYTAITAGTLTFAAGTTSQTFNVAVTGDTTDEANETVVVTLSSPTNATISTANGTGTITDDDGPTVSIDSPSVTEGDSGSTNLTFTATLSAASAQQVTVDWGPGTGGTATSGTDYTAITGGTLTFTAGTTSQTFNVSVTGDTTDELNETVVVTLSSPTNATIATGTGTGTITDDDGPTVSVNSPSVTEGDSGSTNLTFTVTLSAASVQPVTVAYADATTGTATSGTDYTAITGGTLTFAAGTTSQTFNVSVTGDTTDEANETVVVTLSSPTNATISTANGTGTITDDDGPTVSIDSPSVTEGDSGSTNLTFTATLSAASAQQVTVAYADAGTGTATSGTDYTTITGGTLTFPAGTTSQTFNVAVTGDTTDEANETVVVTLSSPTNATILTATGTGTITNDDGPTLSIDSPSVTEGDGGSTNLTFTVTLSPASAQQVTVDYTDAGTGTATSGTDYTAITDATLTFTAGTTSQTFTVAVTGDTTDETNETIVVTLSNSTNATIATGTGTGTITDDDGPTVSVNSPSVTEGDSGSTNLTFTATLSAASVQQVTVDYADATTGTATSGTDYTAITGSTLTFAVGATSQTFNVSVTGDTTDEVDETVVVTLSSPTNATVSSTAGTGTGTITDDDGPTISINSPSVTEGDSGTTNLTFTVSLSAASAQQVTVDYADAGTGTATAGTDYTAITAGTLTFAAGTTSQTFNMSVTGDTTDEADETVVVTLSSATNATISTATGTGTITNDDVTPGARWTPGGVWTHDVTTTSLIGKLMLQQSVTITGGSRIWDNAAIDACPWTKVTPPLPSTSCQSLKSYGAIPGSPFRNRPLTVTNFAPTQAMIDNGGVVVRLRWQGYNSPAGGNVGMTEWVPLVPPPSATLVLTPPSISENAGVSTVTATLDRTTSAAVTITVSAAAVAPAVSGDFTLTGTTLTIPAGTTTSTGTVTLTAVDNAIDAADKAVTVSGTASDSVTNAPPDVTLTITDDDGPTLSIDSPTVTEGDSGSVDMTFTVSLSPASTQQVTVDWADAGTGTATSGTDYTAITGGTLTFPAGTTSQRITVSVTGDTAAEPNETVAVSLSNPANATIGTGTGTGTIADDDGGIDDGDIDAPSLSIDSPRVAEGDSGATDMTFTVTLSPASTQQVKVDWADAGTGTATSGTDYAAVAGGTLTFAAWETSKSFTVSVTGDALDEADETVVVALSKAGNATVSTATGTGTIVDDDGAPSLSIDSPSVAEGDGGTADLTFTATLSAASGKQVTVDWADAGTGTATSGTDYAAIAGGTLAFAAGETSKSFTVSVTGDALDEADETVVVALSKAGNATISTATGTGTIADDDAVPTLSIDSPSVAEGDGGAADLTFTATLSAASGRRVTVDYADAGTGTATSGTDYAAVAGGTLTFPAGTTAQRITVSVTGDTAAEPNETVAVSLSNPANATIGTGMGTGTIADDDAAPTLSIDSPSVAEGDGGSADMTFTVTLSAASGKQVTVDWADAGTGTATSGTDYAAFAGGTLAFAPGETSKSFTVSVTDDALDEADETVVASLSNARNATISTGTGTGTIADDDAAPTLSIDSPSVAEGDGGAADLTFTVTLSAASGKQVTVDWADAGAGTATSGTDYAAVAGGTLAFAEGETSKSFTVSVTDDALDEADETVVASLSNARNATVSTATGMGTIVDDDAAPTLSIDSPSVAEGDGGSADLTFTATLSAASGRRVTVDYADAGTGTATSGTDYAAVAGGTLAFAEGETSKSFTVSVTGDVLDEADETVVAALSSPTNATISTATGTGTIIDDDMTPSFGGAAVPDQSWTRNWPIPALTLPAATGGDGALTYALAPALPAGLSFDAATRELSGTPTRARAATEHTLTATDGDGDAAALSFTIEVTGPVVASIADAQAVEGEPVEFGIALSKPVPEGGSLLVVWRTVDGTALALSDYAPPAGGRGELTIAAGQDAAAIAVQTVDDGVAEGEEAFTVTLVSAGHAELGDAGAAGRIVDDDLARLRGEALQWSLAAFGRTVATEAVDAIGQRFRPGGAAPAAAAPWAGELDALGAPPRVGGGAGWRPGGGGPDALPLAGGGAAGAFGAPGAGRGLPPGGSAAAGLPGGAAGAERSPLGEFLSQVAFESRLGAKGEDAGDGGRWTLWGRGSRSRFSSGSGAGLSLDGQVDTGYLGADARLSEGGPLLGVALSHSVGELGYRGSAAGLEGGRVDVDLNSALPYGHWSVSERASLWALLGVGWGKAVLTDRFGRSESDTSMRMAALGGRGELAPWRGLALALKGDAFAVGMEGSPTLGGAASMPDVDADARRLRVMVEGRRGWQPSARQSLELSLEFGGRWDGGDADAGMGAELGGGLAYRHAAWGLGVEARGRRLLGHAESAFEEWGASVSVALDPGEEGVGASLSLSPVWGEASSGVEGLWRSERLLGARLGGQAERAGRGGWRPGRLRMELGYGFETRGPSLLRLYGGLEEDGPGSRSWRLGGGMTGGRLDWSLELDRRERWGEPPEHGVLLRFGNGFVGAAPAAPPLQGR